MLVTETPVKTKTGTPITLAEAKKQLQDDESFNDNNAYITSLIPVAIDKVENDTNSDVQETDNVLTFEPESSAEQTYYIHSAPLISVSKFEKLNGVTWTDIPATDYKVKAWFSKFIITTLTTIEADKLRVTYKTGYTAATIPPVLKQAALLKLTDFFDNERQNYTLNVQANRAYESLISKHVRTYYG